MEINNYRATLLADSGKHVLLVTATSEEMAIHMIQEAEKCPRSAIQKIEKMETDGKLIDYAYPSSTTATKAGYADTGCWFVALYENGKLKRKRFLSYFLDKAAATVYAETLPYPYHWLHHYLLDLDKLRTKEGNTSKQ
jgi:hypothetical protein